MRIFHSATELIGNTPLLRLSRLEEKHGIQASILAKLEYFNPAGSVKDRIAKASSLSPPAETQASAWLRLQQPKGIE